MEGWDGIMDWVWARHHNEWSWHIRPLLILAFCAAAYFRSGAGVMICALLFPLSAILFPAPIAPPRPEVVAYLERERALLERAAAWQIAAFAAAVAGFLWLLALAFWKRSLWIGLLVANLGGAAKVAGSLWLWHDAGAASIRPALLTAVVVNAAVILAWLVFRQTRRRRGGSSRRS